MLSLFFQSYSNKWFSKLIKFTFSYLFRLSSEKPEPKKNIEKTVIVVGLRLN